MTLEDDKPSTKKRLAEEIKDCYQDPKLVSELQESEEELEALFNLPPAVWEKLKQR